MLYSSVDVIPSGFANEDAEPDGNLWTPQQERAAGMAEEGSTEGASESFFNYQPDQPTLSVSAANFTEQQIAAAQEKAKQIINAGKQGDYKLDALAMRILITEAAANQFSLEPKSAALTAVDSTPVAVVPGTFRKKAKQMQKPTVKKATKKKATKKKAVKKKVSKKAATALAKAKARIKANLIDIEEEPEPPMEIVDWLQIDVGPEPEESGFYAKLEFIDRDSRPREVQAELFHLEIDNKAGQTVTQIDLVLDTRINSLSLANFPHDPANTMMLRVFDDEGTVNKVYSPSQYFVEIRFGIFQIISMMAEPNHA